MRPIGQRLNVERRSRTKEVARRYFVASEGYVTEVRYFTALGENREIAGISSLVEVVALQRDVCDSGISDPLRIVDLLDCYVRSMKAGHYHIDLIRGMLLDFVNIADEVWVEICTQIEQKCPEAIDDAYFVTDLDKVLAVIADVCGEQDRMVDIELPRLLDYREGLDHVCVVVDRDKDSRDGRKIDDFIRECSRFGFEPYISNPCFELWLLMHFEEYDHIDSKKLKQNSMVGSKRFTESELDRIVHERCGCRFRKTNYDARIFVQRTEEAIDRSLASCSNLRELKSKVGTNLGLLLSDMRRRIAICMAGVPPTSTEIDGCDSTGLRFLSLSSE